jgi:hypothetical protein
MLLLTFEPKTLKYLATLKWQPVCSFLLGAFQRKKTLQTRVQIYGPKRDEMRGDWRRLHLEEHCDLYCAVNIIQMMKSRRMRWAGHVARMVLTGF